LGRSTPVVSADLTLFELRPFHREKGKKGGRNISEKRAVPTQQDWRENEA
jgi:hypothetical protein